MKINVKKLLIGKETYPSWATGSTYQIESKETNDKLIVYYKTKTNKIISRIFPKTIRLTPNLIYVLGFLKGEGPTSLGKSNYRRFTITNTDPKILLICLNELEKCGLIEKSQLIDNSFHIIHHTKSDKESIEFWTKKLQLPTSKFKCFYGKPGRNKYGVCHIYIRDVLLRRVIDIVHEEIFLKELI